MKKLTGAGNPFHSALDKAAGMLKRKVGTGAEFMQELNGIPGVKKEEILDRKLHDIMGMPKMTHEQFLGELGKRPAPQIEEKVLGQKLTPQELARETNQFIRDRARQYAGEYAGTSREYRILAGDEMRRLRGENLPSIREHVEREVAMQDAPHHEKGYTLPGGENYREMLIKAPPGEEQFPGVAAHFDGEPGILASMRLKDRTGPNGEKLLHLEELQSDWHQQGREKGYREEPNTEGWTVRSIDEDDPSKVAVYNQFGNEIWNGTNRMGTDRQIIENVANSLQKNRVPDAPFKKNWEEMALKRLIHHAAEKGYHGIVVTPGEEQADRYSLAKHIDSIMLLPNPYPNKDTHPYYFKAFDKEGNKVADDNVNEEKLQEYIGKEPAQQLLSAQPNPMGERMISGANLQIGGEGMKGFYDKKVPNILNSIGKKYGVKTQLHGHQMNIHHDLEGYMPRDQMEIKNLHHFPITEEMRQDVLKNGLPLYKEGGDVHMADGGEVESSPAAAPKNQGVPMNPTIAQMKMALAKGNPLNVQNIGAHEAPSMTPKTYLPPDTQTGQFVPPGGAATPSGLAVGGIDMNSMQPGNQLMPGGLQAMQPPPAPQQPQQGPQQTPQGQQGQAPQAGGNILQMTPQGRAMAAIGPQQAPGMAGGGGVKITKTNPREWAGTGFGYRGATYGIASHPHIAVKREPHGWTAIDTTDRSKRWFGEDKNELENELAKDLLKSSGMAKGGSASEKHPAVYPPSKEIMKAEIIAMADRMARQMTGLENPNAKTLIQLNREKNLPVDVRTLKQQQDMPTIDYGKKKGAYLIGVPGDQSLGGIAQRSKDFELPQAAIELHGIGEKKFESPVPLFGGRDYGTYGHEHGWAGNISGVRPLSGAAKDIHKLDPEAEILGQYVKMTPQSLDFAMHNLDAMLAYQEPHKFPEKYRENLNKLMRQKYAHHPAFPEFPGFEDPNEVLLHAQINSKLRKKLVHVLSTKKNLPPNTPGWDDVIFAVSHPDLRNLETGASGSTMLRMDPKTDPKSLISAHPSYMHELPSAVIGKSKYMSPVELAFPRSMAYAKEHIAKMPIEKQKLVQPFSTAKMIGMREPIDEQYINQIGEYEHQMKKRLGYKKGGKVSQDTMRLELTKQKKGK